MVFGFPWVQPRASLRLALRLQCLGWRLLKLAALARASDRRPFIIVVLRCRF
jgi:hypothetical protein